MMVARSREELEKRYGHVIEEEDFYWVKTQKGYAKFLKPRTLEQVKEILRLTGFPERYISLLENLRRTRAIELALKTRKGLLLRGPAGTGKTTACVFRIAKGLQNYEVNTPLYVSAFDFEPEKVNTLKHHSDCLLIDDLNTRVLHPTRLNILLELIYHAHAKEKKLFITTNEKELKLPEPVLSRISEMCRIFKVDGKDMRLEV